MFNKYLKQSQKLVDEGRPFVVAVVVNYKGPISGKPGDRAIVTDDGALWGWVAGGCSQAIIVEEALDALKSGTPRMIQITPDPENSKDKIMKRKMTCHSGGTMDVYLEPVVPRPQIVILGSSPVADTLAELSSTLDYQVVTSVEDHSQSKNTMVVVTTQGDGDEPALEEALSINPAYLGFVASKKKANAIKQILSKRGFSSQQLNKIKAPAGLDIKARKPEEIALSILAEIVMILREKIAKDPLEKKPETAIDPICGMSVKIDHAKHVFEHQDTLYYFCCEGCKRTFAQEPEKYLTKS